MTGQPNSRETIVKNLVSSLKMTEIFAANDISVRNRWLAGLRQPFTDMFSYASENMSIWKGIDNLSPKTRDALLVLADNGWYPDDDMAFIGLLNLAAGLKDGNREAEKALEQYFDRNKDKIESIIVKNFPHRKRIIEAAFRAHRQKDYSLSIPVLLTQVDGMCYDIAGEPVFMRKDGRPRVANYLETVATGQLFLSALLAPLTSNLPIPISATEKERSAKPGFDALNRHTVLHGESVDFDTETNGLKSISFIGYVASMLGGLRSL